MSDFVGNMHRGAMARAVAAHLLDETKEQSVPLANLRILAREYIDRGHIIEAMKKKLKEARDG